MGRQAREQSVVQTNQFLGGPRGPWRIDRMIAVAGDGLPHAARLDLRQDEQAAEPIAANFALRGMSSHARYVTAAERDALRARALQLGRPGATRGALIPIKKSQAWWDMAQDERRDVLEAQSRHISVGTGYTPAIARQLLHSRDLGEPFDFLTWFDFAPDDEPAFDALVGFLRASPEWRFVEREVDIRVTREG
jgi:Chlorite dismutase